MKKLICMLALLLGSSAQAQVYFESGSARPVNPGAATRDVDRQQRAPRRVKVQQKLVRCSDGSTRTARMCRSHGGIARR
jgi:hypothetical protein